MLRPSVDYPFVENQGLDTKTIKRWVIKSVPSHVLKATAEVRDCLGNGPTVAAVAASSWH